MFNSVEEWSNKIEMLKAERAELLKLAEDVDNNIKILEEELEKFKEAAEHDTEILESAKQLRKVYDSFVQVGFTNSEAFRLVSSMLNTVCAGNNLPIIGLEALFEEAGV